MELREYLQTKKDPAVLPNRKDPNDIQLDGQCYNITAGGYQASCLHGYVPSESPLQQSLRH